MGGPNCGSCPVAALETPANPGQTDDASRGLTADRAWRSAYDGYGPWRNAGAIHMADAFRASFFAELGLVSLLEEHRRLNRRS